jgi:hypothetical protein
VRIVQVMSSFNQHREIKGRGGGGRETEEMNECTQVRGKMTSSP